MMIIVVPDSSRDSIVSRRMLWALFLIAASVFVFYSNTWRKAFLFGDDEELILRNVYLQDWRHLPKLLTQHTLGGAGLVSNFYRPAQMLLYFLLVQIFGVKPWPFVLANVLIHIGCAALLFILMSRLLPEPPDEADRGAGRPGASRIAALAACVLLWALHPIHVEAVANINGTADPLALFWMLAAFLFFHGSRSFLSLSCFALALFSKESAIIFPLLPAAYDLIFRPKETSWKRHLPYWILAAAYMALRVWILNIPTSLNFYAQSNLYTENFAYRFYTLLSVMGKGLSLLFWPAGLHPERSWPIFTGFWNFPVVLSFSVLLFLLLLGLFSLRRNPVASFGVFWFFAAYVPVSNLWAKINAIFWEHWFYAPSVGLCLALASVVAGRSPLIQKRFAALCFPILLLLGWRTRVQNDLWRNAETFSGALVRYEPDSAKNWTHYAMVLAEKKKNEEAERAYLRAIALSDQYPQTRHNLANLYRQMGNVEGAVRQYEIALAMNPNFYFSRLALAEIHLQRGDVRAALIQLKEALKTYPHLPQVEGLVRQLEKK